MTNLSSIEAEASQLVGRLPEPQRRGLQQALADLCESHWRELRGREPAMSLARALWAVTPPLADLCADLYALRDPRLDEVLQGRKPAQAFALLVLTAIERGDSEGAHVAYEPMMLFESPAAGTRYVDGVAAVLRGKLEAPHLHRHESTPPLMKALSLLAGHTGRCDVPALVCVIGLLLVPHSTDDAVEQLRTALSGIGVRFTAIDDGHIQFELHGHAHKPATVRQLGEVLGEIRQAWFS
jgi:hypothetical protein